MCGDKIGGFLVTAGELGGRGQSMKVFPAVIKDIYNYIIPIHQSRQLDYYSFNQTLPPATHENVKTVVIIPALVWRICV